MKWFYCLLILMLSPALIWGNEYEVPVNSTGNLFILSIKNPYQHPLKNIKLNVIENPEWITINTMEIAIDSIPAIQKYDAEVKFIVSDVSPGLKGAVIFSVTDKFNNVLCIRNIDLCTILKPEKAALISAYPNPANSGTTICYDIADISQVNLEIYNVLGRKVCTLVDDIKTAGRWHVVWDGRNSQDQSVSSGTYIIVMSIKNINSHKTEKFSSTIILQK